jgi:DNA-binding transcriptional MerR regulator
MRRHDDLWTLDELGARVALALAIDYPGQASGRVRDVPDRRTIRYYTTLGLLDRPAGWRGRTALYGRRHLLQLVAIKRLQTHGLALAEIQTRLLGMHDRGLQALAQVPDDLDVLAAVADTSPDAVEPSPPREAFWTSAAAVLPEAPTAARPLPVAVPLDDGVALLVEAVRHLDDHDLSALRVAAAPLLKLLRARRLLGPSSSDEGQSFDQEKTT